MSSTGWSRAAPLYKLTVPNDPRLGWAPKRLNIVQWTIYALAVLGCFAVGYRSLSPLTLSLMGIGTVIAFAIAYFVWRRKVSCDVACQPLTEEELRFHIVEVQGAVVARTVDKEAKEQLGEDLGASWLGTIITCLAALWLLVFSKLYFGGLIILFTVLVSVMVANFAADRWIKTLKKRIYERKCVGCGYLHGGPMEPLTLCPECGVMLPVMVLVPPPVSPILSAPPT